MGAPKTVKVWVMTKKGNQFEIELPAIRQVCPRCDGEGSHVNPSIDGNGLTSEDFAEDPDFEESYFRGHYDVACHECDGAKVIDVVNWEALTPKMKDRLERQERQEYRDRQEAEGERRWGC